MREIESLSTTEPILIVKLNQKYRPGMSTEELYEISRQYWVVGPRRDRVKYVVAAYLGITLEVYLIENWYPVVHQGKTRWAFMVLLRMTLFAKSLYTSPSGIYTSKAQQIQSGTLIARGRRRDGGSTLAILSSKYSVLCHA